MNNVKKEVAIFGGGCFWCTEAVFNRLKGVTLVQPGYGGGNKENPTYEEVSSGNTGHAELSRIEFNPDVISYDQLLDVFFHTHDPTSLNRQGADVGTQYRSIILTTTPIQLKKARDFVSRLEEDKEFSKPVVTEVRELDKFYPAEDYHQKYYENHPYQPYCQIVISPKINHFKERYQNLIK